MTARGLSIYITASGGLFVAAWFVFERDLSFVVALGLAVLIHELGHWLWLRAAGERGLLFVSPFLGFVMPDEVPPFNTLGQGIFLLAGCAMALLAVLAIRASVAFTGAAGAFLDMLCFLMLIMNILNLLLPLPITDGGKIMIILLASQRPLARGALAVAGLCLGSVGLWVLSPCWAILLVPLSAWILPVCMKQSEEAARRETRGVRGTLLAAWLSILASSAGLLFSDPIVWDAIWGP